MNPAPRVRLWIPIALCLFSTAASVAATHSSAKPGKVSTALKKPPTTFEGAVELLVENLKKDDVRYLKSYPRCDLISFHLGWGMGIRNHLGLWRGNDSLLGSCARRAHMDSIDPDGASFLLIRGVWDKLHEDISPTDFDTVLPANYFREVDRTLRLAKSTGNTGYLASLPGWMYQVSRFSFFPGADSARSAKLAEEARKQAGQRDSLSPLAILYMTFHGGKGIKEILDSQYSSKDHSVEIPSYTQADALKENFLLQPDSLLRIPPKTIVYFWRTLSRRELAARCFGSLYDKPFKDADQYQKWIDLRRTNELMRWAWKDEFATEDFEELSSNPRKFLEVLLLTNRFFHESSRDELPLVPSDNRDMKAFVHFMNYDDSAFRNLPYDDLLRESSFQPDSATKAWKAKASHALAAVANRLSTEELLQALTREATATYDSSLRADDLKPYHVLGYTLLATQRERLLRHPDKKRIFDLHYRYWKEEFFSFPMQDYVAQLLFQIDPVRARDRFAEEFRSTSHKATFVRTGILQAMIRQDFAANRDFLKRWFWKTYGKYTDYHPNDTRVILQTLASEHGAPQELLRELTADARYRRHPPKKD